MHFCSTCHNMYYLKIREEDGGLNYYCRNCGNEDTTLTAEAICVSETQLRRSEQKFTHMVNEYTKYDPTLPRINTIKCPNQACSSNGGGEQGVGGDALQPSEADSSTAGGAGKKKSEAADKETAAAPKKKTAAASKNKTAKTLAQESAMEATQSAKEAMQSAKEAMQSAKEAALLIAAEEEEELAAAAATATAVLKPTTPKKENGREVIYIRYDDINMKYVYLCVHCDTTWKTDTRV